MTLEEMTLEDLTKKLETLYDHCLSNNELRVAFDATRFLATIHGLTPARRKDGG